MSEAGLIRSRHQARRGLAGAGDLFGDNQGSAVLPEFGFERTTRSAALASVQTSMPFERDGDAQVARLRDLGCSASAFDVSRELVRELALSHGARRCRDIVREPNESRSACSWTLDERDGRRASRGDTVGG